jgi:hypothetical protein
MSNLVEQEYLALRKQRVALRKQLERLAQAAMFEPQKRYGPDGYNNFIAGTEIALRSTEKRWQELCLLLGQPLPRPPVKLDAPVRRQGATTRSPGSYVNRMITSR